MLLSISRVLPVDLNCSRWKLFPLQTQTRSRSNSFSSPSLAQRASKSYQYHISCQWQDFPKCENAQTLRSECLSILSTNMINSHITSSQTKARSILDHCAETEVNIWKIIKLWTERRKQEKRVGLDGRWVWPWAMLFLKERKHLYPGKLSFLLLYPVLGKSVTKYRIKDEMLNTYKNTFLVCILRN